MPKREDDPSGSAFTGSGQDRPSLRPTGPDILEASTEEKENPVPEHSTPDQPEQQPHGPLDDTAPVGGTAEPVASGNRWEPTPGAVVPPVGPPTDQPLPAAVPAPPATAPGSGWRPGRNALTVGLGAAALVLVGGSAFAVGQATAGNDHPGFPGGDQLSHQGVPPGAPGEGAAPGPCGLPGAPGDFDDHDGHDDHDEDED